MFLQHVTITYFKWPRLLCSSRLKLLKHLELHTPINSGFLTYWVRAGSFKAPTNGIKMDFLPDHIAQNTCRNLSTTAQNTKTKHSKSTALVSQAHALTQHKEALVLNERRAISCKPSLAHSVQVTLCLLSSSVSQCICIDTYKDLQRIKPRN